MTFALAFAAPPDGIALVTDTRLTHTRSYEDDVQKTIFPTDDCLVSVAGVYGIGQELLRGAPELLQAADWRRRVDVLRGHIRTRFAQMVQERKVAPGEVVSLIYGDVRFTGGTGSRLIRFDVGVSETGATIFAEQSGQNFAREQAKKFPDDPDDTLPWLCAGLSLAPTREFIGNTGIAAVRVLTRQGLEATDLPDPARETRHARIHQQVNMRAGTRPVSRGALRLQLTAVPDGNFRRTLRHEAKKDEAEGRTAAFDPIQILGMEALRAVEEQVNVFRVGPALDGIEQVGTVWTLATISQRGGLRFFTSPDPNASTAGFGIKRQLD